MTTKTLRALVKDFAQGATDQNTYRKARTELIEGIIAREIEVAPIDFPPLPIQEYEWLPWEPRSAAPLGRAVLPAARIPEACDERQRGGYSPPVCSALEYIRSGSVKTSSDSRSIIYTLAFLPSTTKVNLCSGEDGLKSEHQRHFEEGIELYPTDGNGSDRQRRPL